MLHLLFALFFFAEAQKDAALVKSVKDTLDVCSDIVEAVGDFLSIFESEDRRRSALGDAVTKKLKTCRDIVELVDAFRKNHFSPKKSGHIALQVDEARFLSEMLKGVSKKMGEDLYVASKDGDSSTNFHSKCDNQGPTVVIVQSTTGAVFGGYTELNWKHAGYVKSSITFLFRLRPAMKKYVIKSSSTQRYAIYAASNYGPTFGGGHDLYIASGCRSNTKSYTNGGHSYAFPSYPNYQLTDGAKNFQVKDMVVSKAIKM